VSVSYFGHKGRILNWIDIKLVGFSIKRRYTKVLERAPVQFYLDLLEIAKYCFLKIWVKIIGKDPD
jgi:hypothetical protein